MVFTFFATPYLSKIKTKLTSRPKGEYLMGVIASGATIAVFGSLIGAEMIKGAPYIFTAVVAVIASLTVNYIANKKGINWLKVWSLAFTILISLMEVYVF